MAEEDELYYLQPGFAVSSLTVPKLRGILMQHDVDYSSAAKKVDLVELVESEVIPKAKKILRERERVRRTSRGITDMSSQESNAADEDDDAELMPPPPPPKTPRSRKSKTNVSEPGRSTSRRSRTPNARQSSGKVRASDTETETEKAVVRPSARKTRKSTPGPTPVYPDTTDQSRSKQQTGSSPFSDDNPFQQGSSPLSHARQASASGRKSTARQSSGRPSSSRRRETRSPTIKHEEDGHTSYQFPVEQLRSNDYVPVTEEFTPEGKREVAAEDQIAPRRAQALVRRKKKPASPVTKNLSLGALASVIAALAGWYRQEKVGVGYCGVGSPDWSLGSNPNIPPWVHENLAPSCEPCPQHAICFPDMRVQCEDDFVLAPHPLSLGGLVPVPPTCEPDSEKQRRSKAVAEKSIEVLRERRAAYECGEDLTPQASSRGENDKTIAKASETRLEISEEALKTIVSAQRRRDMSPDEFEVLFEPAIGDVKARPEVEVIQEGSTTYLSSSSLARLPVQCAIRRYAVRTMVAYRVPLSLLASLIVLLAYIRHRILSYKAATAQIPNLVAIALDRLATQAALKEDERAKEAHMFISGLRDDVLRNVFSARERERVWANVRRVVEGNSNVRAATREGRGGEVGRTWEWIGPVDFAGVAGVAGIEGRRSGGYSLGGRSSGGGRKSLGPAEGGDEGDVSVMSTGEEIRREQLGGGGGARNWNEGRDYY